MEEATKKKQEAEKRLTDVKKAQLEKDAEFFAFAPPVMIDVRPSPLSLSATDNLSVPKGETGELVFVARRNFGFAGPISVKVDFPPGSGLLASTVSLGSGQSVVRIPVTVPKETKLGSYTGTVKTQISFNKMVIDDTLKCSLEVVGEK